MSENGTLKMEGRGGSLRSVYAGMSSAMKISKELVNIKAYIIEPASMEPQNLPGAVYQLTESGRDCACPVSSISGSYLKNIYMPFVK